MRILIRALRPWISPAALVALTSMALAVRTTSHLDAVETEVQNRAAALVPPLDKDQKKLAKAFGKASKALGEDAPTVSKELGTLGKVVKTLTKALPQDDPLRGPLTTAVDDFQATLEGDLTEANAEIGALAESKGKTKAANNADAAAQLLAAARAEADLNARVKLLRKGDKKLRAAERAAEKAGAGGGGGGGNCAHPTLQAGESGSFEVDGSLVTANRGSAANFADEFRSGVQIFIESCDGSGPKPEVSLFVPDPAVQDYTIGFSAGNATGGYRDTDGFYELSSNGQLTVTEYDAASGTIAGTFAFENSRSVTAGTFRFTNIQ